MSRDIKVASFLLVALVGLIAYLQFSKTDPVLDIGDTDVSIDDVNSRVGEPLDVEETLIGGNNAENEVIVDTIESTAETTGLTIDNSKIESSPNINDDVVESETSNVIAEVNTEPVDENETSDMEIATEEPERVMVHTPKIIPSTYKVENGDTLSQISQKYIGSIKYMPLIMEKNPELRVDQFYAGITIKLPNKQEVEDYKRLHLAPSRTVPKGASAYIIEAGDTISKISVKKFGDRSKVNKILEMNPDVDPRKLIIGSLLVIPQE